MKELYVLTSKNEKGETTYEHPFQNKEQAIRIQSYELQQKDVATCKLTVIKIEE